MSELERRMGTEQRALKQLLGQNRFLTEQLDALNNRVVEDEKRYKNGKCRKYDVKYEINACSAARWSRHIFFSLLNFPKNLEIWKRDSFQIPTLSNA